MIPKLKNNNFSLFAMLKLVEKDPSFVLLAHQAPQKRHRDSFFSKMFQVVTSIIEKG